jgi:hypothetical protein
MPQYNGVWTLEAAAQAQSNQQWVTDPNFRNTTLLLQADNAANGAQNNTFLDSSPNSFAITRNGGNPGMTQGTFTPFSQSAGRWSNFCATPGTDYLNLGSNANFSFGTGAYTIEFFVYRTANGSTDSVFASIEASGTGWYVGTNLNAGVALNLRGTGAVVSTNSYQIPLNTWTHVVITRASTSANQTRIFINGVLAVAGTDANNWSATGALLLMSTGVGGYNAAGYLSNVRLIKGSIPTAYQTSSTTAGTSVFTSPTTELTTSSQGATSGNVSLLTCQNNRFVDNSATGATVTPTGTPSVQSFAPFAPQFQWTPAVIGGAGYFDGTGDQLTAPNNTVFAFGSGNFTVETWVYATGTTGSLVNYSNGVSTNANWAWDLYQNSATSIQISLFQGTTQYIASSTSFSINAWNHIAAVRNGNTMTIYVNGVAGGTTANVTGVTANDPGGSLIRVSGYSNATNMITGYLSGLRIVKGTAVYTTPFTPPTAPLTAVTNTSLLLNFTNAGIYDAAMDNVLETVGNAQVSTSVVKYGSGSMYFDGSGDVLNVQSPVLQTSNLGSGNLTVEGWLYPLTLGSSNCFVGSYTAASAGHWLLYSSSGTNLALFGSGVPSLSVTLTLNTWQHFAWVKHNGVSTLYLNGVAISSAADTNNYTGANFLTVGAYNGTTGPWNGYLDDVRITKGIARYTANFIPPQVALPRQ